jgi:hypothetical protein
MRVIECEVTKLTDDEAMP